MTGSAHGLGLASARELAARGLRVHVVWRRSAGRVPELERAFPGRVHRADLAEPGAAAALVAAVLARDGRVDALVHAVGEYLSGPLEGAPTEDATRRDARALWESNVATSIAVFDAARAALRASRGSAVFFGCAGLDGLRGRRETALYAAAKSALVVVARGWALEEAAHGVRVNVVSPGLIPHENAAADTLDPARAARVPLGPGRPEDVAAAVAFLCSDGARHVTGADLAVAGGWML